MRPPCVPTTNQPLRAHIQGHILPDFQSRFGYLLALGPEVVDLICLLRFFSCINHRR